MQARKISICKYYETNLICATILEKLIIPSDVSSTGTGWESGHYDGIGLAHGYGQYTVKLSTESTT